VRVASKTGTASALIAGIGRAIGRNVRRALCDTARVTQSERAHSSPQTVCGALLQLVCGPHPSGHSARSASSAPNEPPMTDRAARSKGRNRSPTETATCYLAAAEAAEATEAGPRH